MANELVRQNGTETIEKALAKTNTKLSLHNNENWIDAARFEQVQRIAKVFSTSDMVPVHFRGKLGDCIIAVQMAFRLGIDPFMIMQNMNVISGRPGLSGQLAIALMNERGPFTGPVQWKFTGKKFEDEWTCTAYATHKVTGEVCEQPISWAVVKAEGWLAKNGSKWKTMPDQMFRYRTAAWLARAVCPEVLMGMHTIDELQDSGIKEVVALEVKKADPQAFVTLDDETEKPQATDTETGSPTTEAQTEMFNNE